MESLDSNGDRSEYVTARLIRESLARIAGTCDWRNYQGENSERLRHGLSAFSGRQHVRLCSSGTLGVELALRSLKLPPQSEVMLSAYDYPGNFRAIEDAGCKVALFDVQKHDWVPTTNQLESALGDQTKAIIVSHLHGSLACMQSICEWAKQRGVFVIEDACQEFGGLIQDGDRWRAVGSFGDLSVLSFGGSKLVSAGRGGAVLTDDDLLAQRMTVYCTRGNDAYAMSELQAAVLNPQIDQLESDSELRRSAAAKFALRVQNAKPLFAQHPIESKRPSYYKLGLILSGDGFDGTSAHESVKAIDTEFIDRRATLIERLTARGIMIGEGFRGFASRSVSRCRRPASLDNAIHVADRTLVLHHSHLLDPHTGTCSIDMVAEALFEELPRLF